MTLAEAKPQAPPRLTPDELVEALYREEGSAEIINGGIVRFDMTGREPGYAADEIFAFLRQYTRATRSGIAVGDGKAFVVNLPNRGSFSPDAAYYVGSNSGMKFYEGAPRFAVEVRSENDYGRAAQTRMAAKRRDYFAAGTLAVWDVDLSAPTAVVCKYTATVGADTPEATFARGDTADAKPAVPGWTMPVDDLFEPEQPGLTDGTLEGTKSDGG